jgi:NADH-quinone oxidoreductase subunit E
MTKQIEQLLREMRLPKSAQSARAALVLPALQRIQREIGYLPSEAIPVVARLAGVPESHVYGVATFYAHFRFTPTGKHPITVCCGTACHVRGSAKLVGDLRDRLGIQEGETTDDGRYSLETTACFGSCALAPVVVIDGKVQGRLTRNHLMKTLDRLDAQDAQPGNGEE